MIHKVIAALFIICATVQYNDPDFYIWIPIYLTPALIAIGHNQRWNNSKVLLGIGILYLLAMLTYIPDAISWIKEGLPSITGSMKAESPFIEFVREFFGLVLCFTAISWYWRKVQ